MVFKWNGKWEDGKDHTGEVSESQYWMRMCNNCNQRRGLHKGKSNGLAYPLNRDTICPTHQQTHANDVH